MRKSIILGAAAAVGVIGASPAADLRIQDIRAYLVYNDKGTLSENVVGSSKDFWNTATGDGEAGGMATDVLLDVVVAGADPTPQGQKVSVKATYVAPGARNILIRRTFASLFFGQNPVLHEFIYLADATCATVQIEAAAAGSAKTASLRFDCGE